MTKIQLRPPPLPRGIRNNNPGNIERTHPRAGWVGALPDAKLSDPRFEEFDTPLHGLRALVIVLRNYQQVDGCKTPTQIIGRFAPRPENASRPYIAHLCVALDVSPDHEIDLRVANTMRRTLKVIIDHENGYQPYDDALLTQAIELA